MPQVHLRLSSPLPHHQAVEIVRRYISEEWGERIVKERKRLFGVLLKPDIVAHDKKNTQSYMLYEVKVTGRDLHNVIWQLDVPRLALRQQGYAVACFLAVTHDVFREMQNSDRGKLFLDLMEERGFGVLKVDGVGVEIIKKACIYKS